MDPNMPVFAIVRRKNGKLEVAISGDEGSLEATTGELLSEEGDAVVHIDHDFFQGQENFWQVVMALDELAEGPQVPSSNIITLLQKTFDLGYLLGRHGKTQEA